MTGVVGVRVQLNKTNLSIGVLLVCSYSGELTFLLNTMVRERSMAALKKTRALHTRSSYMVSPAEKAIAYNIFHCAVQCMSLHVTPFTVFVTYVTAFVTFSMSLLSLCLSPHRLPQQHFPRTEDTRWI